MEKMIYDQIVNEQVKQFESQLQEAFLEHFGFPFSKVEDKENLEHIVMEGQHYESYRYRGETFLYVTRPEVSFQKTSNCHEVTISRTYKKA